MVRHAAFVLCLVCAGIASAGDDPRRDEIVSKLTNTKISLDFRDTPLADVMDFVRELSGINILIDPRVYEEVEASKLNISVKIDDLPLGSALRLVLGMRDLTAVYRDGVLLVVTKASLKEQVYTRLYDIRDLLQPVTDFVGPTIELQSGGEGESVSPDTFITEDREVLEPNRLIEMIQDACSPETWGGDKVSIQISNGVLIVCQSREVHAEIGEFLNRLRVAK